MYQIRAVPVQARYGYERSNVTKLSRKKTIFEPVFREIFVTIENIPTPQNSRIYVTILSTVQTLRK